jgi:hypothetical protein
MAFFGVLLYVREDASAAQESFLDKVEAARKKRRLKAGKCELLIRVENNNFLHYS